MLQVLNVTKSTHGHSNREVFRKQVLDIVLILKVHGVDLSSGIANG